MKISVIIPAKNEEKIIYNTVKVLYHYIKSSCKDFEIIVVDDNSSDKTSAEAIRDGLARVVKAKGLGKGSAVREGVLSSEGDFVFFTDADLAYSPDMINKGVDLLLSGADMVVGNRRLGSDKGYSLFRKIASRIFEFVVNRLLRLKVKDTQCGFKGFTNDAAKKIFERSQIDGFCFDVEIFVIAKKLGLKIKNIPAVMQNKKSSISIGKESVKMLFDLYKIKFNVNSGLYD